MAIPDRESMVIETDYEFAREHPGAPGHPDPGNPAQAHLVHEWQELYGKKLKLKVDEIYFSFYPHSPSQLDPNDSSHAQLIEFWNDIRDRIEHGTSRYNWDAAPAAGDPVPDGGQMDQSQFTKFIVDVLAGTVNLDSEAELHNVIGDIDDAGRGPALPWLDAALGAPEDIATAIGDLAPDDHAYRAGPMQEEKEGFCYGVMWEIAGLYNSTKGFAGTADDSDEQLRDAFYAGVAAGRRYGAWPSVRSRVLLVIGSFSQHGVRGDAGYQRMLNLLWHSVNNTTRDLVWSQPEDQHA